MIAEHGYDPVYGARPLRRYIAHEVETKIGRALLRGDIAGGGKIRITVENGELTPTLKIKRRVVDERYRKVIDRIYATAVKPEARQTL